MKNLNMYLVFFLSLCFVASLSVFDEAMAANRAGQFSVSPVIGGITFDGEQHLETRPFYGIRGGYNFTDAFGVEALFDYARTQTTRGDGDVDFYRYGAEMLYHFMPESTFVPYVAAGYAGVNFDAPGGVMFNTVRGAFDYGVGLKYFINDNIALRGDVRHLIYRHDGTLQAVEYSLGLYIPFGGAKQATKVLEKPVEPVPEAVQQQPEEAPLEEIPATEPQPGKYKYCISLNIHFDIDKADIRPQYGAEVARVGDFMKKYDTTTAVIEGDTDNVGAYEHNMELSKRRAESVVNYLVDHFGIERSRLSAKGYGSSRPVADNTTDEGRQKNRRINAIIDCAFDVKGITPPDMLCMFLKIEFDSGKAEIQPKYYSEIDTVGEYLKKYPTTTALIQGYTDNVGGNDYNMKLSQRRAENVVNYLVEKFGIDRSRLTAKGYGSTHRVAYNNTPEGRKKNRRINAIIGCTVK
ncbi:MAG: outer membrane beta-barrel domain-containing protein [Proteobacteria bacterium]|nr:outer membrane beta-barrel domain-containing protein [Pseudomonadota bacterium]